MITRSEVIQAIVDVFPNPRYLEIGVSRGITFNSIRAARKTAVDPKFLFDWRRETTDLVEFHEVTSDIYFSVHARPTDEFDVIYIDGLHTFEQTLRDLVNAVMHLSLTGVVIIDDVLPNSYHAAMPSLAASKAVRAYLAADHDPSWMGDVFKLVFFVQAFFHAFSYGTIRENHGQLVMWRQPRAAVVERNIREIALLEFGDVVTRRECFNIMGLSEIIVSIRQILGQAAEYPAHSRDPSQS